MKKTIIFICVIVLAIPINSCKKTMYYACCDTGHAHWEGTKHDHAQDQHIDLERRDHDFNFHGGVVTSKICSSR
jgi:hypothetical protein